MERVRECARACAAVKEVRRGEAGGVFRLTLGGRRAGMPAPRGAGGGLLRKEMPGPRGGRLASGEEYTRLLDGDGGVTRVGTTGGGLEVVLATSGLVSSDPSLLDLRRCRADIGACEWLKT